MTTHKERLQKICEGKEIRIFAARTPSKPDTATFVEAYRNCGRKSCRACKDPAQHPHGPYWNLNYTDERNKMRTAYVGKKLPDFIPGSHKVVFADIQRYSKMAEEQRETNLRHRHEMERVKKEIESLYEQLRIARKQSRKSGGTADKLFRELVNKYHPDRHRAALFAAEDVMKDINRLWQKMK